jgi:DNA-3-methyladenine glycosylase II
MSGSAFLVPERSSGHRESDANRLADLAPLFAELLARNGPPPDWRREPTFGTLVRLILEQQVSLASAAAAFRRLEDRVGHVTPEAVLASSDGDLKADGFSRQKTSYVRGLASRVMDGALSLDDIAERPDTAGAVLADVKGIGPWTIACFQIFALGLPDIWPTGDRALYLSLARNLHMPSVPDRTTADGMAVSWAPYRSTAARMLWYDYLGGREYVVDPSAGFI